MFNLTLIEITYVIKCHAFEEAKKWKLGNFVKAIKRLFIRRYDYDVTRCYVGYRSLGKVRILRRHRDKMIKIKTVVKSK